MNPPRQPGEQTRIDDPQSGSFLKPGNVPTEAPSSVHIAAYERYRQEICRTDTISFTELSYCRSVRPSRIAVSAVMLEMIPAKQLHDEIERRLRDEGSVAVIEASTTTDIPRELFLLLPPERTEVLFRETLRGQRGNCATNLGELIWSEVVERCDDAALQDVRERLAAEPLRRVA